MDANRALFPSPQRSTRLAGLVILFLMAALVLPFAAPSAQAKSHPKATAARIAATRTYLKHAKRYAAKIHKQIKRSCTNRHTHYCQKRRAAERAALARVKQLSKRLKRLKRLAGQQGGNTNPGPSPSPSPAPAPTPPVNYSTGSFQPGITSGSDPTYDIPGAVKLGARQVRIEFGIGQSPDSMRSVFQAYADKGIRVLPLAGFSGRIPSDSEAANLASWAATYGPGGSFWASRGGNDSLAIRFIEFGNESSYPYQGTDKRGGDYARQFVKAAQAVAGANNRVGVLAQGDDQDGDWFDQMFQAVPNLAQYVAGWTIHPYGEDWWLQRRIDRINAATTKYGAPKSIPVDVTEWGVSTDGGRCLDDNYGLDKCMSYDEAAGLLRAEPGKLNTMLQGRLRTFMMYQVRDQAMPGADNGREHFFGLLQHLDADKPGYTQAAQAVLAMTSL